MRWSLIYRTSLWNRAYILSSSYFRAFSSCHFHGSSGIPAASLVAIVVILKAFGLPPEGIALFMAVDRILDMCRTTVNVLSDTCCAVLVAKSEGEPHILTKKDFSDL